MVTDRELGSAIRAIGQDGEPFSSAALRAHLGMAGEDRRSLTRFNDALRAYCKQNGASLARVGKNRYRLLDCEPESEARPRLPRHVVIRITMLPRDAQAEPRAPSLWDLLGRLGLSLRRMLGLGGARQPTLTALR